MKIRKGELFSDPNADNQLKGTGLALSTTAGPNTWVQASSLPKSFMSGSKMNQAVFPTLREASSQSEMWWGSQWTSATLSGQNYTPQTNTRTLTHTDGPFSAEKRGR